MTESNKDKQSKSLTNTKVNEKPVDVDDEDNTTDDTDENEEENEVDGIDID